MRGSAAAAFALAAAAAAALAFAAALAGFRLELRRQLVCPPLRRAFPPLLSNAAVLVLLPSEYGTKLCDDLGGQQCLTRCVGWNNWCDYKINCDSDCDSCPGVNCPPGQHGAAEHVTRGPTCHGRAAKHTFPHTPVHRLLTPSPACPWRSCGLVYVQQQRGSYARV